MGILKAEDRETVDAAFRERMGDAYEGIVMQEVDGIDGLMVMVTAHGGKRYTIMHQNLWRGVETIAQELEQWAS